MSKNNTNVNETEVKENQEVKETKETNVNVEGYKKENKVVCWAKKHAKPLVGAGLCAAGAVVGLVKLASTLSNGNGASTESTTDSMDSYDE